MRRKGRIGNSTGRGSAALNAFRGAVQGGAVRRIGQLWRI